MKSIFFSITLLALLFSCNKKTDNASNTIERKDSMAVKENDFSVQEIPTDCYIGVSGSDSVFLKLNDNLGTITGKMAYSNAEKDSSAGEVMGYSSGDTLHVEYLFTSEGVVSSREIKFLKSKDGLLEGIGTQDAGVYTQPSQIKFEGGYELQKADCKLVNSKL